MARFVSILRLGGTEDNHGGRGLSAVSQRDVSSLKSLSHCLFELSSEAFDMSGMRHCSSQHFSS